MVHQFCESYLETLLELWQLVSNGGFCNASKQQEDDSKG